MMMEKMKMTVAEKKRIESLDKQIKRLEDRIVVKRHEYDALVEKLDQLLSERYPERNADTIKEKLYKGYVSSTRSMDEIMAFIEGRDDEIDW